MVISSLKSHGEAEPGTNWTEPFDLLEQDMNRCEASLDAA